MRAQQVAGLAMVFALLPAGTAAANPPDVFGLGSRAAAMAGAVTADVSDFSANYYNPGGLVRATGTDISVGYMSASHEFELNGYNSKIDPVRGLVGGVVAPGVILDVPFAFGLGVHLSDDRVSRARTIKQEDPRWVLYENRAQLLYLSTNIAVEPVEGFGVGGGITFLAATRGAFDIEGTATLPGLGATVHDSQLRHEVDADLTATRYPQAGVWWDATEALNVALAYRGESKIDLDIAANLDGTVDAGFDLPARYELVSKTINAFIPRQIALGASVKPADNVHVNLDIAWVNWASYQSPVSRSDTILDVGQAGALIDLPENIPSSDPLDPDFEDRFVPRLGVEWIASVSESVEMPVRAGYSFEQSPVPEQSGLTNYVDSDRHIFAAGVGVVWKQPGEVLPGDLRIDGNVGYSFLPLRVTLKDNPADFVGDYSAQGDILVLGVTTSLGFD
jgi:long-subunit fatty acid transport protein